MAREGRERARRLSRTAAFAGTAPAVRQGYGPERADHEGNAMSESEHQLAPRDQWPDLRGVPEHDDGVDPVAAHRDRRIRELERSRARWRRLCEEWARLAEARLAVIIAADEKDRGA